MLSQWLQRWVNRNPETRSRRARRRQVSRFRPRLEMLEDRNLLSTHELGILEGGPSSGTFAFHPSEGSDFFNFRTLASASSSHYVSIDSPYTGDLSLRLFNEFGTLLASSITPFTNFESISLQGLPPGNYQAVVWDSAGFIHPQYFLTINAPVRPAPDAAEPNDSFAFPAGLGVLTGLNNYPNLTIDAAGDDDWYVFQTTATGRSTDYVRIEQNTPVGNVNLALLNSAGGVISFYENFDSNKQLPLTGLASGTYYIRAYGLGHTSPSYTMRVQAPIRPLPDSFEHNDSIFSASNLGTLTGLNSFTNLTVDAPFDDDWFVFQTVNTATASNFVRIEHDSAQGNLNLALFDGAGYLLAYYENFDANKQIPLGGLPPGAYYLRVYGLGHTNANYTLRVQAPTPPPGDAFEPNDTFSNPWVLGAVNGLRIINNLSIHLPGSQAVHHDWFRFTIGSGATTGNHVRADFYGFLGDIDMELFSATGTLLGVSYGVFDREEISLAGLPAGDYVVHLFGYAGVVNPLYTLTINAPATAVPDWAEPNNTIGTARDLLTVQGVRTWGPQNNQNLSLHQAGDVDWFQFALNAAAGPTHFARLDFSNQLGDIDVLLYNSSGVVVGQSQGFSDREQISLQGLPTGNYYLAVYGFLGATNPSYTLTVSAPGAGGTDRYESNNVRTSATDFGTIRGTRVESDPLSLHPTGTPTGDEDWFRFTTTQAAGTGHLVGIVFDHLLGDVDLELYDNAGVLLTSSAGARNYETVNLSGRPAGTYYVRVVGYQNAANPEYRMVIVAPGSDAAEGTAGNNTFQNAFLLRNPTGMQSWPNLSISPPDPTTPTVDDVDWFRLDLTSPPTNGHYARIDFVHAVGDLDFVLYRSNGTTVERASRGVSDSELVSLDGLATGTYYLQVVGFNRATNPNYTLTVNAPVTLTADWAEANNARTSAYNLGQIQVARAWNDPQRPLSIHNTTDEDWYRFDTVAQGVTGHQASLLLNHAEGDLDLELYGSTGNLIERSAGVGDVHTVSLANQPMGIYYLRVVGHNGATSPRYALMIQPPGAATGDWAEANNDRLNARNLGVVNGQRVLSDLSIHQTGDRDWFQFQLGAAGQNGHRVALGFSHAVGDLDLRLLDANGIELAVSAGIEDTEQISLQGQPAGVYYVEVLGRNNAATNPAYTLALITPDTGTGDWAENNDTRPTAYNLRSVNGSQSWGGLSMHAANDDDYYAFQLTGNGVEGSFAAITFDPTLGDLDLRLLDASGAELAASTTGDGFERISLESRQASSGGTPITYYLRVNGHNGATNPGYLLQINAPNSYLQPDWAEPNDDRPNARDLQKVEGARAWRGLSVHAANNHDWFRFETTDTGTEGQLAAIAFDHTEGDLELRLYNSSGVEIASSATVGDREEISLAGRTAGVYYLRVAGNGTATSPAYELMINAPQPATSDWAEGTGGNNTRLTAYNLREVTGVTSVSGLSIHTSDTDWYRFALTRPGLPGQIVRIDFDNSQGNLTLALFDAAGTPINRPITGTGNFREISLDGLPGTTTDTPPTGTPYYVQISGVSGARNPNYSLTITAATMPTPDRFEANDSLATAYDLRQILQSGSRARSFGGQSGSRDFLGGLGGQLAALTSSSGLNSIIPGLGNSIYSGGSFNLPGLSGLNSGPFGGFNSLSPGAAQQFNQITGLNPNSYIPTAGSLFNPYSINSPFNIIGSGVGHTFLGGSNLGVTPSQLYNVLGADLAAAVAPTISNLGAPSFANQLTGLSGLGFGQSGTGFGGFPTGFSNPGLGGSTGGFSLFNNPAPPAAPPNQFLNNFANTLALGLFANLLSNLFDRDSTGFQPTAVLPGLSLHSATDSDWFRFDLSSEGTSGQHVRLRFDNDQGNLDLELHDAAGRLYGSATQDDLEEINLTGLPAGTYYVRVFGAANPSYELSFGILPPPASPTGDWAEANETRPTARDLRAIEGTRILSDLSIHNSTDRDWFAFTTRAVGQEGHSVRINFNHTQGDLDIALYSSTGTLITNSAGARNFEEISFATRTAGTYYIEISGYQGAINPQYTLSFDLPFDPAQDIVPPDALEPNNVPTQPTNLNQVSGLSQLPGLTIHTGDLDWFRFTTSGPGTSAHSVGIQFEHSAGDLQLELFSSTNFSTPIRFSRTGEDNENITLQGLATGTYYVRVSGQTGTPANRYQLNIDVPTQPSAPLDDWTILVYMTASDLAPFAAIDINEMEQAAALLPGTVNIAVLYDQSSGLPTYETGNRTQAAWGGAGRGIIRPDTGPSIRFTGAPGEIATSFDLTIGEQNTADPQALIDFINWATNPTNGVARARHYALILWDHGGGINGSNQDDEGNQLLNPPLLTAPELAQALQTVQITTTFDLVAFDACLMAMTEVIDTLRPYTPIMVGSEEIEDGSGYDYRTAFAALTSNPSGVTGSMLASSIVQSFGRQYEFNARGADTQSALDTADAAALVSALQAFSTALPSTPTAPEWNVVRAARNSATSFINSPNFRDLGQFMDAVASGFVSTHPIAVAARNVSNALDAMVVAKTNDQRDVSGLSIYLPAPGSTIDSNYDSRFNSFLTASGWRSFLQRFISGSSGLFGTDWSEGYDTFAQAYNLHLLSGLANILTNLGLDRGSDQDFFRFSIDSQPTASLSVTANYQGTSGLRLTLFDAQRNPVGTTTSSPGVETVTFSLAGLPAGERLFYVRVEATGSSAVPLYSLTVNAPTAASSRDWARGNDVSGKARDLGVISEEVVFAGLSTELTAQNDWFTFDTPRNESQGFGVVHVRITGGQQLSMQLLDTNDTVIRGIAGTGELRLEYASGAGASYRLRVFGSAGQPATGYSLRFEPPGAAPAALPFVDDFNRFNSPALGPSWTERWGDYTLTGNRAAAVPGVSIATVTGLTAADVRLEADVDVPAGNGNSGGLMARYAGPYDTNSYWGGLFHDGTQYAAQIRRRDGTGAVTLIGSSVVVPSGVGRLRFEVVGNNLSLFINDVLITSGQNSAITAAGAFGVRGAGGAYDNFRAELIGGSRLAFSASGYSVNENGGVATITVTRTGSSAGAVSVAYATTTGGTATAGTDYTAASGTLSFANGETSKTFTVAIQDDSVYEGNETINLALSNPMGATLGSQSTAVLTIVENDPAPLQVVSSIFTWTGFQVTFNRALDTSVLNLYDAQGSGLGAADATLVGNVTGPVRGSLLINPAGTTITFLRTGGVMVPDTYTVTLISSSSGFRDTGGSLLDGDNNGIPGGNWTTSATFNPTTFLIAGIGEFARGPGQAVNVPATGTGVPLYLSDGTGVRQISLTFRYNPALLNISGVQVPAGLAGATASVNTSTPGEAVVTFNSPTDLPAGPVTFAALVATVPNNAPYGSKQLLDIFGLLINGAPTTWRDDDGIHVVGYFGDTSGNAAFSSTDATRTLRAAVGLDSGFAAFQLADPVLIADVNGNGSINSIDANRIMQESLGIDRPEIPALPGVIPPIVPGGPDPYLNLPTNLRGRPGDLLTVPVNLDLSDGLETLDLALAFDSSRLEIVEVRRGSLTGDFDLFLANVDALAGTLQAGLGRTAGQISGQGSGSVLEIVFRIKEDASEGGVVLNLRHSLGVTTTQLNEGGLDLIPDPSDEAGDELDGLITVTSTPVLKKQLETAPNGKARETERSNSLAFRTLLDSQNDSADNFASSSTPLRMTRQQGDEIPDLALVTTVIDTLFRNYPDEVAAEADGGEGWMTLDLNGDGQLDRQELSRFWQRAGSQR